MNKDLLYRFFSGECSDAERAEVRRWVESGPEARTEYMQERRLYDLTLCLAPEYDDDSSAPRRPVSRLMRVAGMVAAAVLIAVLSIGAYRFFAVDMDATSVPMQTLTVPPGQRLQIALGDGTTVWLNSQTVMRFPGVFAADERRVEIDGEAYFEVAKDAEHPFVVNTKAGKIRVTGTTFNVDAYSTSPEFSVSLVEGAVSLETPSRIYKVEPGQTLEIDHNGAVSAANLSTERFEWVDGIVSFSNMSLADILSRFEKYYGITIEIRKSGLTDERFTGRFYLDEGVSHALNVLSRDLQFSYTKDQDNRRVVIE